jgi:hypothetical protein
MHTIRRHAATFGRVRIEGDRRLARGLLRLLAL